MVLKKMIGMLEQQEWLDPLGDTVQSSLESALNVLGSRQRQFMNLLHGTWLGHPAHPPITDVPVGAWTTTVILDGFEVATGRDDLAPGADLAIIVGLVGGTASAWTGLADWKHTGGSTRRLGLAHGLLNIGAAALFGTSLVLRRTGLRGPGQIVSLAGYGMVVASSYIGGELIMDKGIGVDHSEKPTGPEEFTPIASISDLEENAPYRFNVDGETMVVVRSGYYVAALSDSCAHLGVSLAEGHVHDGCITCAAHGSTYNLRDGSVVSGPSPYPQPLFDVRVVDEQIEVRRSQPQS